MYYPNAFAVSYDENLIVGAKFSDRKTLVVEDIDRKNGQMQIGKHSGQIGTISSDEDFSTVLVADNCGHVIQYKQAKGSWFIFKKYGNLGIGDICSNFHFGNLVIYGGYKHLRFINTSNQKVIGPCLNTKLNYSFSLLLFEEQKGEIFLDLSGNLNSAYDYVFDVYNLTDILEKSF